MRASSDTISSDTTSTDTIVARATPPGHGGIAVIRLSGPEVPRIAGQMLGTLPEPRHATLTDFVDASGRLIDQGVAIFFPGPGSFTGEDVLELQGHGGPVVVGMLIDAALALGARMARPGEFTERAFLNDKFDLTQAEAIADLIDADSKTAARAATRSLRGRFSAAVMDLNRVVTELRVHVEAAIDFPEEEIDFLDDESLAARLDQTRQVFERLEQTVRQGCLLRDGVQVVLAGRPNAGKSSLLNALAGYDAAIVTDIPGTTRDLVREHIEIDGLPVHIVDTAGLRAWSDDVERQGVQRARQQISVADHALVVIDASCDGDEETEALVRELPGQCRYTVVRNKIDLTGDIPGPVPNDAATLNISALTGAGIDTLRETIKHRVGFRTGGEGTMTARQRHLDSLQKARRHFDAGCRQLADHAAGELMAEELLQVQNALAEITGEFSSDDLLGEIFGNFCIGK